MIKKAINQNDSFYLELLNSIGFDNIFSNKPINRFKGNLDVIRMSGEIKNKYQFRGRGGGSFQFDVQPDDMDVWLKLWNTAPPKKGQTEGATKGVGIGEISLYWLYHYSNSGIKVDEGRSGYIVDANNISELEKKIISFFNSNDLDEMPKYIESNKEKFSWEYHIEGILELADGS